MTLRRDRIWQVCGLVGAIVCLSHPTLAQVAEDNTLGAENSRVIRNVQIRGVDSDRIEGGARRGQNLFHSFQQFSVEEGRGTYFLNPDGVRNIIGRITGGGRSDILGRLGVISPDNATLGTANLFLINPNGIVFGANSSLDIAGSFVGTTGDRFTFLGGTEFSAVNPQAPSLLTISTPIGVQFGGHPSAIAVEGNSLSGGVSGLLTFRTLALIGGDIRLDRAALVAAGGRIELGAAKEGEVGLTQNGNLLSLRFPETTGRANILIANDSAVGSLIGGSIVITAQNLDISGSALLASTLGGVNGDAGNITLDVKETTSLTQQSTIANLPAEGGGGDIQITTGSLSVGDRSNLTTETLGLASDSTGNLRQSNAGDIVINARNAVSFANSGASTNVRQGTTGNGGNIEMTVGSLSVTDSTLNTSTDGFGDAGDVILSAHDSVAFDRSSIFSSVGERAEGNGGNIKIETGSLSLTNFSAPPESSALQTFSDGEGNAGSVIINARDHVIIDDVNIFSSIGTSGSGRGGSIEINSGVLSVTNSGLITGTNGIGKAGDIVITSNSIFFSGGGAYSNTTSNRLNAEGYVVSHGGNVEITTNSLDITNGAQIFASTSGRGNAGNVTIDAHNYVLVDGIGRTERRSSSIYSSTESGAMGQGGAVRISVPTLVVANGGVINARTENDQAGGNVVINTTSFEARDGGQVVTTTSNSGRAGNIVLNAIGGITLAGVDPDYTEERQRQLQRIDTQGDASGLYANAAQGSTGYGGSINITTERLNIQDQAQIAVSSQGTGSAGTLNVNAGSVVLNNQASLTAETRSSSGGNINLQIADNLNLGHRSQINASTENGQGGSISLNRDRSPTRSIQISSGSRIATEATGAGNAGTLTLNTQRLMVQGRTSSVSAASRSGQGGAINIDAAQVRVRNGGSVVASTQSGRGGSIRLRDLNNLLVDNGGEITASTRDGQGGRITLGSDRSPAHSVQISGK